MSQHLNPQARHDFVLIFDVTDGNPNGDPDGGNMPRTDPETSHGLVTDVCIKRKVRNYVATYSEHEASEEERNRLKIFVEHHGVLNEKIREAYVGRGIPVGKPAQASVPEDVLEDLREIASYLPSAFSFTPGDSDDADEVGPTLGYSGELSKEEVAEKLALDAITEKCKQNKKLKKFIDDLVKKSGKPDKSKVNADKAKVWMCENFYDVRMFGAVMSTGLNAGQVRGPMQLTFARSADPVQPQDMAVTRVAVTDSKDREKLQTIGRKTLVPYGLYVARGFYSPYLAEQTGITESDLALFWQALVNMWDFDRSASRGMMAPRGLYVFSHEAKLGNAPAHKLFERVDVALKVEGTVPRQFDDYAVTVDGEALPAGITLEKLTEG